MSGTLKKNFRMFQELCGERTLRNIVIVTTMWGEVDRQKAEKREVELREKDVFFKPILKKHAQMARHLNIVNSAHRILRLILHNFPLPQRIQEEIVDEGKNISETGAGGELNRELNAQIKKHKEDMRALEEEVQQAMKDKDEEAKRRLAEGIEQTKEEIKRIEKLSKRMVPDYQRTAQSVATGSLAIENHLEDNTAVSPIFIPILAIAGAATHVGVSLYKLVVEGATSIATSTKAIATWIIRKITDMVES